jgi:hypothetical protein
VKIIYSSGQVREEVRVKITTKVPILKAFLFQANLLPVYTAIGEDFDKEMKEPADIRQVGITGERERLPSENQDGNRVSYYCRMAPIINSKSSRRD